VKADFMQYQEDRALQRALGMRNTGDLAGGSPVWSAHGATTYCAANLTGTNT